MRLKKYGVIAIASLWVASCTPARSSAVNVGRYFSTCASVVTRCLSCHDGTLAYKGGIDSIASAKADDIAKALEPIVPHAVINLGSEEHHAASLLDFYPSITGSIIMSWIVMAVTIALFWFIARSLREIPGKLQNAIEFAIEGLAVGVIRIGKGL